MTLRFNSDGTFRVLQMADIQDGPNVREDTIRLIEAAIKKTLQEIFEKHRGEIPAIEHYLAKLPR